MSKPYKITIKSQEEKPLAQLDDDLLSLVQLAMDSNVSKEQFRKFIQDRAVERKTYKLSMQ